MERPREFDIVDVFVTRSHPPMGAIVKSRQLVLVETRFIAPPNRKAAW
jgi:hypothetical protein